MSAFLADTLLLLDLQRQLAWNAFLSRSLARKLVPLVAATVAVVAVGGISTAAGFSLGRVLRRFPELGLESLLPGAVLSAVALLLVVVAFGTALGSLFLADDLPRLMAAPVQRRAVFVAKLLDGMQWYYAVVAVAAGPALVAYGMGLGYGPLYYALGLLALLGTPLLPAGIAALLVMVVVRFAPASRVREFLGLTAALVGVSCSVAGQTFRLWSRQAAGFGGGIPARGREREELAAFLETIRGVVDLPIPSLVAGRGLAAAGRGDIVGAVAGTAVFLLLTFGFFAVCVLAAETLYEAGWTRMQGSGVARRRRVVERAAASDGWLANAPAAVAVAIKDWRVFPRDLTSYRQLLAPLIAVPAVYFNLFAAPSGRRGNVVQQVQRLTDGTLDLRGVGTAAAVLLLCAVMFNRVALTSIARERGGWWVLKSAPVTGMEILHGKLLVAAVPYVGLSTLLMAAVCWWNGFGPLGSLYGWLGVEALGLGMLALNVGLSVPAARLDWDDPRRMVSGWGAVGSMAGTALIGLVGGALLCLGMVAAELFPPAAPYAWFLGLACAVGVSAALGWLGLRYGASRLPRVGEVA
ncbi:MAG TPA: hypothetical protein VFX49_21755 [Chloroflexota bacterium]|nr:hypothetical protein [Chloroflexota bacterium]